jgi:hypothetical protein
MKKFNLLLRNILTIMNILPMQLRGFSSSDLAQIIARIFDEVSVPPGGLNEPHDELPVEV